MEQCGVPMRAAIGNAMSAPLSPPAEWFYVGFYGQLGPLTQDQMEELVRDGVIERDTYVWKAGMDQWAVAGAVSPFSISFVAKAAHTPPPVPTGTPPVFKPHEPSIPHLPPVATGTSLAYMSYDQAFLDQSLPRSDKNRVVAGVLQILLPGVGRMYLGYGAIGVLQFLLWPCFAGWVWSVVDGIMILTGSMKLDGYGRRLPE